MKKIFVALLTVLLVLSTFGCTKQKPDPTIDPVVDYDVAFSTMMDQWFKEEMEADYLSYHFGIKNPDASNIVKPEVSLGEVEIDDEEVARVAEKIDTLKKYDTKDLSAQQLVTYQTALSYYEILFKTYDIEEDYGFLFTPNSGINNNLVTNFQEFEIRSEQDAKDLIALVVDGERFVDECIDYTKQQADDGIIQGKATMESVIDSLERFTAKTNDSELIKAFDTQIDQLGYSASLKEEMKDAVVNHLIPAYQRAIDLYKGLLAKAPESKAICEYDNGKKYYEILVSYKTSTTKDINTIEEELEDAIDTTLDALYEVINRGDNYADYGYTTPEAALELLKSKMGDDFPEIPTVNYTVNFLDPSVTSPNTAAYYLLSPVDDVTNNVIKVNPAYGEVDPNGLVITLSHEGYPGHLFQHTYFYSKNPEKIRYCLDFTAYAEGWAMYAEDWAYTQLERSKYSAKLNSLYDQLMYYIYSYVDILYNYEGYDTDDVANFLENIFNKDYAYMLAESLKDTVLGDPALFIPYGYGEYKMLDLKQKATNAAKENGKKFDLKEFNTLILDTGDTSFDVLEKIVAEYYGY